MLFIIFPHSLPSIVDKVSMKVRIAPGDVAEAIASDLPVSPSEIQKMRSGRGSSFHRTIEYARKVCIVLL